MKFGSRKLAGSCKSEDMLVIKHYTIHMYLSFYFAQSGGTYEDVRCPEKRREERPLSV